MPQQGLTQWYIEPLGCSVQQAHNLLDERDMGGVGVLRGPYSISPCTRTDWDSVFQEEL